MSTRPSSGFKSFAARKKSTTLCESQFPHLCRGAGGAHFMDELPFLLPEEEKIINPKIQESKMRIIKHFIILKHLINATCIIFPKSETSEIFL